MKKTLLSLLIIGTAAIAFGQPSRGPASVKNPVLKHLGNDGQAHTTQREALDSGSGSAAKPYLIHLDTTEIDTGYVLFHVLNSPIYAINDTLGVFSFTCKDSTGADTTNVIGKWTASPRCDGKGVFENLDSVTYKGATSAVAEAGTPISSSYTNKRAYVVNTGGFCSYRFYLRNPLTGGSGARKATCKDAVFIERRRGGVRP